MTTVAVAPAEIHRTHFAELSTNAKTVRLRYGSGAARELLRVVELRLDGSRILLQVSD